MGGDMIGGQQPAGHEITAAQILQEDAVVDLTPGGQDVGVTVDYLHGLLLGLPVPFSPHFPNKPSSSAMVCSEVCRRASLRPKISYIASRIFRPREVMQAGRA